VEARESEKSQVQFKSFRTREVLLVFLVKPEKDQEQRKLNFHQTKK